MKTILLLNGPNMNLLGTREVALYGAMRLSALTKHLEQVATTLEVRLVCFQSNHEGELIDCLHTHRAVSAMILNAGAYAHTSIAIRDAIVAVNVPFIEVHMTNVYRREQFRHFSYLSDLARGAVHGLGVYGYEAALRYWAEHLPSG